MISSLFKPGINVFWRDRDRIGRTLRAPASGCRGVGWIDVPSLSPTTDFPNCVGIGNCMSRYRDAVRRWIECGVYDVGLIDPDNSVEVDIFQSNRIGERS